MTIHSLILSLVLYQKRCMCVVLHTKLSVDHNTTGLITEKHVVMMSKATGGPPNAPVAPWMFALAGRQHSEK